MENLYKKQKLFIHEIFDEIQRELQVQGKQVIFIYLYYLYII